MLGCGHPLRIPDILLIILMMPSLTTPLVLLATVSARRVATPRHAWGAPESNKRLRLQASRSLMKNIGVKDTPTQRDTIVNKPLARL